MDEVGVSLADAVDRLRVELAEATRRGAGEEVRFELGTVKVAFEVSVADTREAGGGIRFWVVNAEARGSGTGTRTHRVEVELTPVIRGARNPLIASEHVEEP